LLLALHRDSSELRYLLSGGIPAPLLEANDTGLLDDDVGGIFSDVLFPSLTMRGSFIPPRKQKGRIAHVLGGEGERK
jgi:hypothetical protein